MPLTTVMLCLFQYTLQNRVAARKYLRGGNISTFEAFVNWSVKFRCKSSAKAICYL